MTVYRAPAGDRVAGAFNPARPFDAVLPDGRIVTPFGSGAQLGSDALGMAVTPDGKYVIVTGSSWIGAYDASTLRQIDVQRYQERHFFTGVIAEPDPDDSSRTIVLASGGASNVVRVFDLPDGGALREESDAPIGFPTALAFSGDGRTAYVANGAADTLMALDVANRRVLGSAPVGFMPAGIAVDGERAFVTNQGVMGYAASTRPLPAPSFASAPADTRNASSLTTIAIGAEGNLAADSPQFMPLDGVLDGVHNVGGTHPSGVALTRERRYAFVSLTGVDHLAIVSLIGSPHVVGQLSLQLFAGSPYGTQPGALTVDRAGRRLFVALPGLDAVALIDISNPARPRRLGLIPTGWDPIALALSPNGRALYVTNAKGSGSGATLQRIDLHRLPLTKATLAVLRNTRTALYATRNQLVPPLRSLRQSSAIKHVVLILEESKTFDSMLGDLTDASGVRHGNGDGTLTDFPASVTPNLHELARRFALADNFYSDAERSDTGHQAAAGGTIIPFAHNAVLAGSHAQDPEDYPRAGYIFNELNRAGLSYRDYGDLVRLAGYREDGVPGARPGLGGHYSLDVPALAVLDDCIDLNYPGWNPAIPDVVRAREFVSDYDGLAKSGRAPAYATVWLPEDAAVSGAGLSPAAEQVADGDRALGTIVDYLTHSPQWGSTAIFIMPADAGIGSARDHVERHRTYALIVSPYARRGYVGHSHLSTVSVLKTEEELLGLPALAIDDLLASDMADFFTGDPDPAPFAAIGVPLAGSYR